MSDTIENRQAVNQQKQNLKQKSPEPFTQIDPTQNRDLFFLAGNDTFFPHLKLRNIFSTLDQCGVLQYIIEYFKKFFYFASRNYYKIHFG
jgi:hypothetical protein